MPDDAGTSAQQRTVEQIVKWLTRQKQCTSWTKSRSMRRRERRGRCELRLHQLRRARSHEPCDSNWKESGSRKKPGAATSAPEHALRTPNGELTDGAGASTETSVCAEDRTNSSLHIALPERIETQPAVTYATLCPVVEYIAPVFAVYAAAVPVNEYATPVPFICHRGR